MSDWYLVYCKARQEVAAASGLEEQGYQVYLPKLRCRKRRSGGMREIEEPLFPRYIFIAAGQPTQSIGPAQFTRGVQKLVRFGKLFLTVPDVVVTALRARENPDTGFHQRVIPAMKPGDRVRIGSGAFEGIEGIFEARTGHDRVVVLLNLLGQQTRTVVPIEELEQ